jgi:2-alkyl-3-oxoalkanoate reductase
VPKLIGAGHSVTALTRTREKAHAIRGSGAEPVVADAFDRDAVVTAVREAGPDVVVHQLTALSSVTGNPRRFDREFALTNRLRT